MSYSNEDLADALERLHQGPFVVGSTAEKLYEAARRLRRIGTEIDGCWRCRQRGWPRRYASRPMCAFRQQWFSPENWQCVTMGALRLIAETDGLVMRDDDADGSIAVVPTGDRGYIVLSYYKDRGRTAQAVVMHDDEPPRTLLLEDAEHAIAKSKGEQQ